MEHALPTLEKRLVISFKQWPGWIGYLALLWSALYGALHLYWLLGGDGYPFKHTADMGLFSAMVTYLPVQTGGSVFVVLCLLGVFISLAMQQSWGKSIPRWSILTYAWGMVAALLLFVPDIDLSAAMAYALRGEPAWNWSLTNQVICIMGALCWGFAALAYQRRTRQACQYCGRRAGSNEFLLVRWGRWLTYLAALAPLPYALCRLGWALGIPVGVDPAYFRHVVLDNPTISAMFIPTAWVFGALSLGGGLLTVGLIQPWGERFPRWFPFLGGKRVPISLAVIPASLVALAVTVAGFIFTFSFFVVILHLTPPDTVQLDPRMIWGTVGPMLLWIPWGVALGLASIAYYYRRRGRCAHCGREG